MGIDRGHLDYRGDDEIMAYSTPLTKHQIIQQYRKQITHYELEIKSLKDYIAKLEGQQMISKYVEMGQ